MGKKESLVAIYEYQGKYFGRIIGVYDEQGKLTDNLDHPVSRAPAVQNHPYYAGLDLLWDFEKEGSLYKNGKIIDPEKGRIYNAEMWRKDDKLVLRGKVWIFGGNVIWDPATESDFPPGFNKPDYAKFVPVIPQLAK